MTRARNVTPGQLPLELTAEPLSDTDTVRVLTAELGRSVIVYTDGRTGRRWAEHSGGTIPLPAHPNP